MEFSNRVCYFCNKVILVSNHCFQTNEREEKEKRRKEMKRNEKKSWSKKFSEKKEKKGRKKERKVVQYFFSQIITRAENPFGWNKV